MSTIGFPQKVNIMGIEFDVKRGTLDNMLGIYARDKTEIIIDKRNNEKLSDFVFWHEVLHGLFRTSNLPIIIDIGSEEEELFIDTLAYALYNFLKSNVKSIEWKEECNGD